MAIVVENKKTFEKYILVGAGLGMFKATRPSYFGGNLFPHEEESVEQIVAVCNHAGEIHFLDKDLLKVIEIDSVKLIDMQEIFVSENKIENISISRCPGCNERISDTDSKCPYCELRLK